MNPDSGSGSGIIHFTGTSRTTPYNDYGNFEQYQQILFDSGAGSFNLTGDSVKLYDNGGTAKIENNSSSAQTFSLSDGNQGVLTESNIELDPTAADLTINTAIYADHNSGIISVYGNNGHTLTLNAGIGQYNTTGSLFVHDNDIVILNSASTYTGGTTINGGVTFANNTTGSATGSGGINIVSGGKLAGSGTVGNGINAINAIAVNGTIGAGPDAVTIGTLTTGSQNWNATGTYAAKLGNASASDELVMSGLSVSNGFAIQLSAPTGTAFTTNEHFVLAEVEGGNASTFNSALLGQLTLALNTTNTGAAAGHFTLSEQSDTANGGGEDLVTTYDATPEPTSALLLTLAAAPLAVGRRRPTPGV